MKRVHQRVVKFMPQISVGALDRHIFNLRRKLADDTHEPRFIETVADRAIASTGRRATS